MARRYSETAANFWNWLTQEPPNLSKGDTRCQENRIPLKGRQILQEEQTMYDIKKLLLIMRHAKSDQKKFLNDFDRPLNKRGKRQPKTIAKKLKQRNIEIDLSLVSPSLRTSETFKLLQKNLLNVDEAHFDQKLYNGYLDNVLEVLKANSHNNNCLLLIGHNPSVSEVTAFLSNEYYDFKTANLAILSSRSDDVKADLAMPGQFILEEILIPDE